jgi:hypothetical protein
MPPLRARRVRAQRIEVLCMAHRVVVSRLGCGFGSAAMLALLAGSGVARAQGSDTTADPTGAPPADAKALVDAPKKPDDAPAIAAGTHSTTVALSAGGLFATGNSRTLALTVNGNFELRRAHHGFGASILGNYGEGGTPGNAIVATAENLQVRARYDYYILDELSAFLIGTERHDRFQGLDVRLNIDPGVKYLFVKDAKNALWLEAGYDFQYDVRRDAARAVLDDAGNPTFDAAGNPILLAKTKTDHSSRLFAGFRRAFNKEVTLTTGVEYLQSFVDSTRYRVNFDAIVAASLGGGFSLGFGLSARYDHAPLPGKQDLDTSSTLSLIYGFSDVPKPAEPPPCPPAPAEPAPAAPAAPSPAAPTPAALAQTGGS